MTLLEVMLAAGLLLTLMVAVHEVTLQSRRVARVAARTFDAERVTLRTLRRLRLALGAASPYTQAHEENDFAGDAEDLRWTTVDYRADPSRLGEEAAFLRGALPGGTRARPATLHLGQDGEGTYLEVLPVAFLARESSADEPSYVERWPDVRSFELAYFDGEDWKDTWDFRRELHLPELVRVRLVLTRETPQGLREEDALLVAPLRATRDVAIR